MDREAVAPGNGYDIGQLLDLVRANVILIAASAATFTILAALYILLQDPVYRATSELLIAPQALQIVGRDIVRSDSPTSLEMANVDSQASIILSTSVLRQVANKLDLGTYPEFQPHVGLIGRLIGRPPLSDAAKEAVTLDLLKQSVVVHRVDNSLVLQVTVSDPNASRAADIANALAAAYLQETAQDRIDSVTRANASIIAQVSGLRTQLNKAEEAVERFRSQNGLIRSSENGLVVTQQLNNVYTQIDAAVAEVARLAARKQQADQIRPEALLTDTAPDVLNSPTLVALRTQYAQIAREAASQARTLLPQHPHMVELRAQMAEGQMQVRTELTRLKASLADSYNQAVNNLKILQAKAKDLTQTKVTSSEAETKLRQLESEADAVRTVLNASLNRAQELDQQGRIETNNSHVTTEAVPPLRPSNPPLLLVMAAAALFGTCVGIAIAYLKEIMPRRRGGGRMTPREAGLLLGIDTVVALPRLAGFGQGLRTSNELGGQLNRVAFDLRSRFKHHLPAVVMIAEPRGTGGTQVVAERLGEALADLGEDVLVCGGWTSSGDLTAARIEGRRPLSAARTTTAAHAEFIITTVDLGRTGSAEAPTAPADAVLLAVDLARTGPNALLAAARAADPSRRRLIALLALNSSVRPEGRRAQRSMVGSAA